MVRLFSHSFPAITVLRVVFDAILVVVGFMLAALWLTRGTLPGVDVIESALLFAIMMIVLNTLVGLYRRDPYRSSTQTAARIAISVMLAAPIAWLTFRASDLTPLHREAFNLAVVVALVLLVAGRAYATRRAPGRMFTRRVLVLGTGADAMEVDNSLRKLAPGMTIVGFYRAQLGEARDDLVPAEHVFSDTLSLRDTVVAHDVDDLIVAVRERRGGVLPLNQLLECKLNGVRVLDLSSYYERAAGQVRLDTLHASWLIFGEGFRQGIVRTTVKRVFDIMVSLILLVLALPVAVITAALVAIESGFPVLYSQERIGLAGRVIRVIKFRSMYPDAERDGVPRWANSNDQRVTRVGRFIRKLRIDELPQLINVIKGDMSLVGPRPERPFFVDDLTRHIPFYAARHSVKPGITGWAQVRYHYGASVDDAMQKLQYDLYYVKNHTLFLDLLILFETVGVVISGEGAQ